MKPLVTRRDAENNLQLALESEMKQPAGVWLAFGDCVLLAGRLVKHPTSEEDSFRPAMPFSGRCKQTEFDPGVSNNHARRNHCHTWLQD
ncbi:hypothetical protein ASD00_32080 [Ensifer sp. Root31]|nr:hypothetical protein ASD00_32080 [Ensifer sp. Root31]